MWQADDQSASAKRANQSKQDQPSAEQAEAGGSGGVRKEEEETCKDEGKGGWQFGQPWSLWGRSNPEGERQQDEGPQTNPNRPRTGPRPRTGTRPMASNSSTTSRAPQRATTGGAAGAASPAVAAAGARHSTSSQPGGRSGRGGSGRIFYLLPSPGRRKVQGQSEGPKAKPQARPAARPRRVIGRVWVSAASSRSRACGAPSPMNR